MVLLLEGNKGQIKLKMEQLHMWQVQAKGGIRGSQASNKRHQPNTSGKPLPVPLGQVSEMVLRSGGRRTGEESDPEYRSGDEGGNQHNRSESSASEEVSSSSSDHKKGELRSKKRRDFRREGQREVGHKKGYGVKEKGKVEEVKRRSTSDEREDDGKEQAVNALLQAYKPESMCFKLGQREVPFSLFDVALLMGFPATRKHVAFERSDGGSEVEQVLKGAMEERVCKERWCSVDLVHVVEDVDGVGEYNWAEAVWEFLVHTMEESREKIGNAKNLQINGFAMILQVWFYEHSTIYAFTDERSVPRLSSWVNLYKGKKYDAGIMVRKLKDSEIIPVIEVRDNERRIQVVEALITSENYSAYVEYVQLRGEPYVSFVRVVCYVADKGIISVEERLQRARDALRKEKEALAKEKEAHATKKKELAELKEAVAMKTTVEDILKFARIQGLSSTADAPKRPAVGDEGTKTDIFTPDVGVGVEVDRASPLSLVQSSDVAETITAGENVPSGKLGAHPVEAELVAEGEVGEVQGQSSAIRNGRNHQLRRGCGHVLGPEILLQCNRPRTYTRTKRLGRRSKKNGGVSAAHVARTDMDVGGAPPDKVGDESSLGSSQNANVEAIVRAVAEEGFPTDEVRADDVEGCIHIRMVAEAAEGTVASGDLTVDYVHNSTDPGGTYDGPMVVGVDVIRYERQGAEADTSAAPSMQTSAIVEDTVDEGHDGSGKPSAVAVVVTTSDEDSSPASSEATHGRQPPTTTPPADIRASEVGRNSQADVGKVMTSFEDSGVSHSKAAVAIASPPKYVTEEQVIREVGCDVNH
ncbi:hypothetical protein Cgig2_022865 [Carnegiea gigantea]|uniref:Uncharacterized protein n=1 Tax=Carnegiea gigantea TaxID=171969 RepID=A0A9Q1QMN0_9CARY|nr:hypothetical protein Cgig2_022865 [Carnegiea gigantea]